MVNNKLYLGVGLSPYYFKMSITINMSIMYCMYISKLLLAAKSERFDS